MRGFKLPIMIGCYDKADKTTVICKDKKYGGYSLIICYLKERQEVGQPTPMDNIGKVICHLHFCKLDNLKAFAKCVDKAIELWEDEAEPPKEVE